MVDKNDSEPGTSRRRYLRAVGSVALLSTVVGETSANTEGPNVTIINRPYSNPISVKTINKLRREGVQKLDGDRKLASISPEGDGRIVSFVVGASQNGKLFHHIGIARKAKDTVKAHRKAKSRVPVIRRAVSEDSTTFEERSVSTQETSWTTLEEGTMSTYSSPHGDLNDYYRWNQSDDDSDAYTLEDRFATTPGTVAYGSEWVNSRGKTDHNWPNSYSKLQSWQPFGGTSGSVSKTYKVSANLTSGVSVGYSYGYTTSETEVSDKTVDNNEEQQVSFTVSFNNDAPSQTTGFDPASLGEYTGGGIYPTMNQYSEMKYFNPQKISTKTISHSQSFNLL